MVERIYVKPLPGKRVTDPVKWKPIPEEGCWVNKSPFWLRRLKYKDVEFVESPKVKSAAKPKAQPKKKATTSKPKEGGE